MDDSGYIWFQVIYILWLWQDGSGINKRDNPHKYLLYKPTFSQLFTFLASGFKELPSTGAMLLYLSADGCSGNSKHSDDSKCIKDMPMIGWVHYDYILGGSIMIIYWVGPLWLYIGWVHYDYRLGWVHYD